jgi:hypothetical protein
VARSFVVQLRADADIRGGVVTGRVEHVRSGAAAQFESVEQLMGWICDTIDWTTAEGHAKEGL